MKLDPVKMQLLKTIADLEAVPEGAYNVRDNGTLAGRNTTAHIDIVSKTDKPGIDIIVREGTKNERVDIPVLLTQTGLKDLVYNDFYIADGADVLIVAGCGIHNDGGELSQHDGVHTFHVGKNAHVKYVEKHYGEGEGTGERVLNPTTVIEIDEGGSLEMDTVQIKGVDSTYRKTSAVLAKDAKLLITEKIMTHGRQTATTDFYVKLGGDGSSAHVISRSVAKGQSHQQFLLSVDGDAACYGHTECDAIVLEGGTVSAVPKVNANNVDARLIHEAAIGKIAGDQLDKLMTLGLSEAEAEEMIINGFLK